MEVSPQTRSTIWRFDLTTERRQSIQVPAGSQVLSVGWRDNAIVLWVAVDPEVPKITRRVLLASTGHVIDDGLQYVGTVMKGTHVWHVFVGAE